MDAEDIIRGMLIGLIISLLILPIVFIFIIKSDKNGDKASNRFERVSGGYETAILYDRETKVMYLWNCEGGYTVMIDENGKPLLYEGEDK